MSPDQEAFLAKKKEKAAARRQKPEEKGELGMTSLMDIVSIIVVYLLKSYASDPVVINPTAGQKIPLSTADAPMQDGIPIFITLRGITFDNKKVVSMTPEGDIDPTTVSNHLIGPLYDALAEEVDKAKQMAEQGKKLAEQGQTKLDEAQRKFNEQQAQKLQTQQGQPAQQYDNHGRPITPQPDQAAPQPPAPTLLPHSFLAPRPTPPLRDGPRCVPHPA